MRQICAGRLRKYICVMSVMLLMFGMCFRVMETDSFLSHICETRNAATLENVDATIQNVDVCSLEVIQRQDTQTVRNELKRSARRYVTRNMWFGLAEVCMPESGENSIRQESSSDFTKCFNHIAILNFIHSQDGEK